MLLGLLSKVEPNKWKGKSSTFWMDKEGKFKKMDYFLYYPFERQQNSWAWFLQSELDWNSCLFHSNHSRHGILTRPHFLTLFRTIIIRQRKLRKPWRSTAWCPAIFELLDGSNSSVSVMAFRFFTKSWYQCAVSLCYCGNSNKSNKN